MTRDRYESLEYDGRLYDEMRSIESENDHLQKELKEKAKEIERLKNKVKEITEEMNYQINLKTKNANIINELEKWLSEENGVTIFDYQNAIEDVLDKLRELKGDSSNE